MTPRAPLQKIVLIVLSLALIVAGTPAPLAAQAPQSYTPQELDKLVSRIALYPDPLLAQVLAAATFPDQIPDAAKWADEHHYLRGDDLARAIAADHLPWDPSVQALLPFPSVLQMMASDMNWTTELGNAFLAQQQDVMDAVQRMRKKARDYGYLRSNAEVVVSGDPYVTIVPVNPDFIVVPVYDPLVVFAPPPPGFFVGGAIVFGFGVTLGFAFHPWGWEPLASCGIGTKCSSPIRVNWVNRATYVRHYDAAFHRWAGPRGVEQHELIRRDEAERNAARLGHVRPPEIHHAAPGHHH